MLRKCLYLLLVASTILGGYFLVELFDIKATPVLNPQGIIASKQKELIITGTWLMLIIVIPVFFLCFFVVWKYRSSNKKATYRPDWDMSVLAETIWWGFPCVIVACLSVLVWKSSHELDPFKPLSSPTKPLRIQAVALQWRWLFIYPEQGIASVNFLEFPEKTPLHFEITSDAPMNSFWIPSLGGQIYAMPGMRSQLNLIADAPGEFRGSSANLSGEGFANMNFAAKAVTLEEFEAWVKKMQGSSVSLDLKSYTALASPSVDTATFYYVLKRKDLYDQIIMKYMMPSSEMAQ